MKKYLISKKVRRLNNAGSKAIDDIITIAEKREDIQNVLIEYTGYFSYILAIITLMVRSIFFKNRSIVFIQHQHMSRGLRLIIKSAIIIYKIKGCKVVGFIHDVEGLRNDSKLKNDLILTKYHYVIAHNNEMKKELVKFNIAEDKIFINEIFDYLTDCQINHKRYSKSIYIAGNLDPKKSNYIYQLDNLEKDYKLSLYGPNFVGLSESFQGQFSPDELISRVKESFGLIWDGDSIETCTGFTGEYLRFNNPHKLSLCLVMNIPPIIWDEAATAKFIVDNQVGYTIKNLNELSKLINSITSDDYEAKTKNLKIIQKQLSSGHFTNRVINQIIKTIEG